MKKILLSTFIVTGLLGAGALQSEQNDGEQSFSRYVGKDGSITRPTGYRAEWAHLGSWAVIPGDAVKDPAGPGFHDVYTQRSTVEAYNKTGEFPDGAVLVKEIRKIESAVMTTGEANWAAEPSVWFVSIKDTKGRFPDNPKWGDGWGWALFEAADPSKDVSTDFRKDCLACHLPAKKTDSVYVQGYPTLKKTAN